MFTKKRTNRIHELISNEFKDVETCLIHFESFLLAVTTKETPFETLEVLSTSVANSEAEADRSLRQMIESVGNAPLLPATRQELIEVATSCDKIANKCEDASRTIVFRRFRFPEEYASEVMQLISITRAQFDLLKTAVFRLFMNFSELLKDHAILDEIRAKESEVDKVEQVLYKKIFAMDMGLAERNQMARMVELVCDISDIIENIADKIQIMLITRRV